MDAGIDERIMLVSRDEQSCLVVSYREIKSCIEAAFGCVTAVLAWRLTSNHVFVVNYLRLSERSAEFSQHELDMSHVQNKNCLESEKDAEKNKK